MTNEQKRMLRVVAAYNDITEEQAEKAIVTGFLNDLLTDDSLPLANMVLHVEKETPETCKDKVVFDENGITLYKPALANYETPEKPRKKPGRKPKTVEQWASDTAREVRQAEKMSKGEFVEYFGGKS